MKRKFDILTFAYIGSAISGVAVLVLAFAVSFFGGQTVSRILDFVIVGLEILYLFFNLIICRYETNTSNRRMAALIAMLNVVLALLFAGRGLGLIV